MKTKVIIVSGFLGSGKTTLIKKYLESCKAEENIVVLENEFGEVSIDSKVLSEDNLDVYEINNGCICCTLLNDFKVGVNTILEKYNPDKIIIEPSGVAKVSDIVNIVENQGGLEVAKIATLVNAFTFEMNADNFGDFYRDQIKNADLIFLTRLDRLNRIRKDGLKRVLQKLNDLNPKARVIYEDVDVKSILDEGLKSSDREYSISKGRRSFQNLESYTFKVDKVFEREELKIILDDILNPTKYGLVIRSKGIVKSSEGFLKFDYVDGEVDIQKIYGVLDTDIVVIGEYLERENLYAVFENL